MIFVDKGSALGPVYFLLPTSYFFFLLLHPPSLRSLLTI